MPSMMLEAKDDSSTSGPAAWHDACGYCTLASASPMVLAVCASVVAMVQAPAASLLAFLIVDAIVMARP